MNERSDRQDRSRPSLVIELFEGDANGRKMIAWGRRIGCRESRQWFEPRRGVNTRLLVDTVDVQHNYFLM